MTKSRFTIPNVISGIAAVTPSPTTPQSRYECALDANESERLFEPVPPVAKAM